MARTEAGEALRGVGLLLMLLLLEGRLLGLQLLHLRVQLGLAAWVLHHLAEHGHEVLVDLGYPALAICWRQQERLMRLQGPGMQAGPWCCWCRLCRCAGQLIDIEVQAVQVVIVKACAALQHAI